MHAAYMPATVLLALLAGAVVGATGHRDAAHLAWMFGLIVTGGPVVARTILGMLRGQFAADLVAALAIGGAFMLGLPLAGLVIVLMQTGGEALEQYAEGRASEAVRALERAAPRVAHRVAPEAVEDIPVDHIEVGDRLLVRPGEMLPCDAEVEQGQSDVDTSSLTGEPLPRRAMPGVHLPSGAVNGNAPLVVRAHARAGESQYAKVVQLVRSAQASKAPIQRLADRYATWFTPFILLVCGGTWLVTGDAVRVLAILVVATPCPLILATPVAVLGGLNRAARRQVIFRHGTALEQLGSVTVGVFDKTGTLTVGQPAVSRVDALAPLTEADLLRFAAAVEVVSGHLLARTVVAEARRRELTWPAARHVVECPGEGVQGEVDGHSVAVGGWSFIERRHASAATDLQAARAGEGLRAFVAVDGRGAGVISYADAIRPGLPAFFDALRRLGLRTTVLLSGDAHANAEAVARQVGLDEVAGDLRPGDKAAFVQSQVKQGDKVMMVGDGINDAPALSAATVGIALAAHGDGVSAEAADAVLLVDDPTRIAEAITISRDTMRIARQGIWVGLGLSGAAMGVAAAGYIAPVPGAVIQELIDVGVILNALRAARSRTPAGGQVAGPGSRS